MRYRGFKEDEVDQSLRKLVMRNKKRLVKTAR